MAGASTQISALDTFVPWLALRRLPGVGTRTQFDLLEHFGSIEAIFSASRGQLEKALVGKHEAIDALLAGPDEKILKSELKWLSEPGHHLLTWSDPDYPALLREIPDPPLVLYIAGERQLLSARQLAIVGSRNPTPMGRENARAFAKSLAGAGLAITSGMALGVDGAAHRGALVSEFPLGTPPLPENFPVRNRIISGLSLGTLVVEAALRSGSLITARMANEQGREVFAVPGSIHAPQARGCHALIRQGAKLVETAQDILEELGPLAGVALQAAHENTPPAPRLDSTMVTLLEHIGHDPVSIDILIERSGLTADAVSSMLLQMELNGLVSNCPGGKVQRITR